MSLRALSGSRLEWGSRKCHFCEKMLVQKTNKIRIQKCQSFFHYFFCFFCSPTPVVQDIHRRTSLRERIQTYLVVFWIKFCICNLWINWSCLYLILLRKKTCLIFFFQILKFPILTFRLSARLLGQFSLKCN